MATQKIPLFGSFTSRNVNPTSFITKDQLFVNCWPEITRNPLSGKGKVFLHKRQGFVSTVVADATYNATTGAMIWTSGSSLAGPVFAYSTQGPPIALKVYAGTVLLGASFQGPYLKTAISETSISNVSTIVIVGRRTSAPNDYQAWYYQSGGAWTQVVDVDYPGYPIATGGLGYEVVGNAVHMDGYMFVKTRNPARIYQSDLNSVTSWGATNYIESQSSPDFGVGLAKLGPYIYDFNDTTIEVFHNTGNATGSVLSRIPSASLRMGAHYPTDMDGFAIQTIGDAIYFIGRMADDDAFGVYKITGPRAVTKLSSPSIDKLINEKISNTSSVCIRGAMTLGGYQHLMLAFGNTTDLVWKNPMFCIDTNIWWFFRSDTPHYAITACVGYTGNAHFMAYDNLGSEGRNRYLAQPQTPTYQDDSTPYTMTIQTENLDQGTQHRKLFTSAELVCDTQTTSGNISISWSDDDYATFSTARTIDPSTGSRRVQRLGSTKKSNNHKRAWKIEETINRPFRGTELVLEYDVGEA